MIDFEDSWSNSSLKLQNSYFSSKKVVVNFDNLSLKYQLFSLLLQFWDFFFETPIFSSLYAIGCGVLWLKNCGHCGVWCLPPIGSLPSPQYLWSHSKWLTLNGAGPNLTYPVRGVWSDRKTHTRRFSLYERLYQVFHTRFNFQQLLLSWKCCYDFLKRRLRWRFRTLHTVKSCNSAPLGSKSCNSIPPRWKSDTENPPRTVVWKTLDLTPGIKRHFKCLCK